MDAILQVDELTKRFGPVVAVDQLSLTLRPGEIVGLVGPDGAGKTTTFRLLVGALRPDSGRGRIAGFDLLSQIEQARPHLGYLPQRFSLYPDLTVSENLRFFAEVNGLSSKDWRPRRDELLAFVGLTEFADRLARQLSGGMKQKLGLATALIHRPKLLLLDEPTGGVDPVTRQDFWQLIGRAVAQEGLAVLVSTPYMDEASRCTRLGFLQNGHILAEGSLQQLTAPLQGRILEFAATPRAAARLTAQSDPAIEEVQPFGDRFHCRIRPGALDEVRARLPEQFAAADVALHHLRPIAPTLEDVFINLLRD